MSITYSNEIIFEVAEDIKSDFGSLDDISMELANTITNIYAINSSPGSMEAMFLRNLGQKNNAIKNAHMVSCMDKSRLIEFVESLREMARENQNFLKKYTEQFLIDILKYGMDFRGLGGFPFIRSIKRPFLKPLLEEDQNLYQKVRAYL